jgi:hypothetical protein
MPIYCSKLNPKIGAKVYRYQYVSFYLRREGEDIISSPVHAYQLFYAQYLRRNGSWRYYRNQKSGMEWKENGMDWDLTEDLAYTYIFEFLSFQMLNCRKKGYNFYLWNGINFDGRHPFIDNPKKVMVNAMVALEDLIRNHWHLVKQMRKSE